MRESAEIIIPTYNGEEHLSGLLESLSRQDTDMFRVIISDNGSKDNTIGIAQSYRDKLNLTIIDSSGKAGKAFALNRGVEVADAARILFIDQDDTVNRGYVTAMTHALEDNPLVAACMDPVALNRHFRVPPRDIPHNQKFGKFNINLAAGGTIGVQKTALEQIGGFDEEFNYSTNDVEFCYRAHQRGFLIKLVGDAIVNYRLRDTIQGNFQQGLYYGQGNFAIAQKYPEIRGDQKNIGLLTLDLSRLLVRFLIEKDSRAKHAHEIGKTVGQLQCHLNSFKNSTTSR